MYSWARVYERCLESCRGVHQYHRSISWHDEHGKPESGQPDYCYYQQSLSRGYPHKLWFWEVRTGGSHRPRGGSNKLCGKFDSGFVLSFHISLDYDIWDLDVDEWNHSVVRRVAGFLPVIFHFQIPFLKPPIDGRHVVDFSLISGDTVLASSEQAFTFFNCESYTTWVHRTLLTLTSDVHFLAFSANSFLKLIALCWTKELLNLKLDSSLMCWVNLVNFADMIRILIEFWLLNAIGDRILRNKEWLFLTVSQKPSHS